MKHTPRFSSAFVGRVTLVEGRLAKRRRPQRTPSFSSALPMPLYMGLWGDVSVLSSGHGDPQSAVPRSLMIITGAFT